MTTKIAVGEVLRVPNKIPASPEEGGYLVLQHLVQGPHKTALQITRGITPLGKLLRGSDGVERYAAILLFSNPLAGHSGSNPWTDVIDAGRGYALYHGDNKVAGTDALQAEGNRLLYKLFEMYTTPEHRRLAPPILLFEQVEEAGRRFGFRRFCGYGIPSTLRVQTEAGADGGTFGNLVLELDLFHLENEAGLFDWQWIYDRRDPSLASDEANRNAPQAWRSWIKLGDAALAGVRSPVRSDAMPQEHVPSLLAEQARKAEAEGAFDPTSMIDARQRMAAEIVRRQGQPRFRRALLAAYGGRCAITGCDAEAALEAAHIVPYRGPRTNDPSNGLLLRADIHTLFDLGLITVDTSSMSVVVSPVLMTTEYGSLQGRTLRAPDDPSLQPSVAALAQHHQRAQGGQAPTPS